MANFKEALTNEVSFSSSSDKMLKRCRRQYWYQKYMSWNGWWQGKNKPPPNPRNEEAYVAKHADTLASWAGSIVHGQAEWGLKQAMEGRRWDNREDLRNRMLTNAADVIDRGLKQSKSKSVGNPKKRVQLVEVEFGIPYDEEWLRERVRNKIGALTALDDGWMGDVAGTNLFLRAMGKPDRIVLVEELLEFKLAGLKVYIKGDLIMRSSRSSTECVIVDWKTGQQRADDASQLRLYDAWASSRHWTRTEMLLIYLGEGTTQVVKVPPSEDQAASVVLATEDVEQFKSELSSRLVNGDLARNQPIEERFEPTSDWRECGLCPYQRMCARDGTKPTPPTPVDAGTTPG